MKWSYSTREALRRCHRSVAFSHLLASSTAHDSARREAYVLKQLQHLSAWQGSIVHAVLATSLIDMVRTYHRVDAGELVRKAVSLAGRQFAFSASARYRDPELRKATTGREYCALFEHEYGLPIPEDILDKTKSTFVKCFNYLATLDEILSEIKQGSHYMVERPLHFALLGTAVVAVPDLVFSRKDGRVAIIDWKISASLTSDYLWQMFVNALALTQSPSIAKVSPTAIDLFEVNLLQGRIRRHAFSEENVQQAEDFVYRGVVEFQALFGDVSTDNLDLHEFDVASNPETCSHCKFARPCIRNLTEPLGDCALVTVQGRLL